MSGGAFDAATWQAVVLVRRQAWAVVSMPFDEVLQVELDRDSGAEALALYCGCERTDAVCDACGDSLRTVELAFSRSINDRVRKDWFERTCEQGTATRHRRWQELSR